MEVDGVVDEDELVELDVLVDEVLEVVDFGELPAEDLDDALDVLSFGVGVGLVIGLGLGLLGLGLEFD